MRKQGLLLVGLLTVLLGGTSQARANLIVNGGFETGDFTGWTLSGNPGYISITSDAHSGNYAASFGAVGSPTDLSQAQTVATVVGHSYTLDYWLKNDGGPVNSFSASFGGTTVQTINNANAFGYTHFVFSGLVATSTSTSVSFTFRQDPSYWIFDDVSLVDNTPAATPEPASITLLGLGALGMIGYGWRRRKQNAAIKAVA